MRIDLHTHSFASDGTESPGDLVRAAAAAGLDAVALTDHDTTQGWAEAARAAREAGIALVPGIEVSTRTDDGISVHVLGYLFDPADPALLAELDASRESRVGRARTMVDRLAQDYPITWDDVLAQASEGATIGRPHIADALVANGVVPDRSAAFADLLHSRSRYHVPHYAPHPVEAVRLLRRAGGVAVMAHPFAAQRGRVVADPVVEEMAAAGLAGLEANHRDHDEPARSHALDLANRLGLLVTGSSDYHGTGKPNRLGENLTEPAVLEQIEALASSGTSIVRP